MTDLFDADENATPLGPGEKDGLIPTHVTLKGELNELEQKNIAAGDIWAFSRKRDVTDEGFLLSLHKRMFGNVWRWAGQYRKTERNFGVLPHVIDVEMRQALDNAKYQVEHKSYEPDELAVRFHHKLVVIHPFANGNGRWSRMAGDLMITQLGGQRFTWGSANLRPAGEARDAYINALKAADNHDFGPLIGFARS
jgi:Fic-DOC domain mobile mystery protein B